MRARPLDGRRERTNGDCLQRPRGRRGAVVVGGGGAVVAGAGAIVAVEVDAGAAFPCLRFFPPPGSSSASSTPVSSSEPRRASASNPSALRSRRNAVTFP